MDNGPKLAQETSSFRRDQDALHFHDCGRFLWLRCISNPQKKSTIQGDSQHVVLWNIYLGDFNNKKRCYTFGWEFKHHFLHEIRPRGHLLQAESPAGHLSQKMFEGSQKLPLKFCGTYIYTTCFDTTPLGNLYTPPVYPPPSNSNGHKWRFIYRDSRS